MTSRLLRTGGAACVPVLTLLLVLSSHAAEAQRGVGRTGTPLTGELRVKLSGSSAFHTMGADSIIPFTLDTTAKRFEAEGTIPFTMTMRTGCQGKTRLKVTLSGPVRGNTVVISTRSLELAPFALTSGCPQQINLSPVILKNVPDIVLALDSDAAGVKSWPEGPMTVTLTYRWAGLRAGPGLAMVVDSGPKAGQPIEPGPPDTSPIDTVATFAPRPRNPLTVRATPNESRATSAVIPVGGGTVRATGADGTRFTLTVPANAFLEATAVTLTPVTVVSGLPLSGGLAAAVQMAPEGLQLREPATLTIEPARPVPVAELVSFAWYELGEDFHLYPLHPDPAKLQLPVFHFSGSGVGRGTNADRAAQLLRVPIRDNAWYFQWTARIRSSMVRGERTLAQGVGILVAIGRRYYETVLRPKLLLAVTDEREFGAFADANAWQKSLELFGEGGKFAKEFAEISELYPKALRNAFDKAYDRCTQQHDFTALPRMAALARELSRIGIDVDVTDRIEKCFRFELVVESRIDKTDPVTTNSVHVRARIPLEPPTFGELRIIGQGPLTLLSVSARFSRCQRTSVTKLPEGGEITPSVSFTFDQDTTAGRRPQLADISMLIIGTPGAPGTMDIVCGPGSSTVPMPSPYWDLFGALHSQERAAELPSGFRIPQWEILGGELYAQKRYVRTLSIGGLTITENTTFELRHTPGS